jgi:hypothetical protein
MEDVGYGGMILCIMEDGGEVEVRKLDRGGC